MNKRSSKKNNKKHTLKGNKKRSSKKKIRKRSKKNLKSIKGGAAATVNPGEPWTAGTPEVSLPTQELAVAKAAPPPAPTMMHAEYTPMPARELEAAHPMPAQKPIAAHSLEHSEIIEPKLNLEGDFIYIDQKINHMLEDLKKLLCQQPEDEGKIIMKYIKKLGIINLLVNMIERYFDLFQEGFPLGLMYANLYVDFVASKLTHICINNSYLSEEQKYRNYKEEKSYWGLRASRIPIRVDEPKFIETINKNPYKWSGGIEPQIYWEDISYNLNRKLLLTELHDIKSQFGRELFTDIVLTTNVERKGSTLLLSNDPIFDSFRYLDKKPINLDNPNEADIIENWNWYEITKKLTIKRIGTILLNIIKYESPYHASGWGMFRYFNFVKFVDYFKGTDKFQVNSNPSCACMCVSLIFITILLLTGYDKESIFARMDKSPINETERASHWAVDIKCNDVLESFQKTSGLITIGNICSIDKNIFLRYTSDIIVYYKTAINNRIHSKYDNENYEINVVLINILIQWENRIKKLVASKPCILK